MIDVETARKTASTPNRLGRRPGSNRNHGRLGIGMVAGIRAEWWPVSRQNPNQQPGWSVTLVPAHQSSPSLRPSVYRRLALRWGVLPLLSPHYETTDEMVASEMKILRERELVEPGDVVVITCGIQMLADATNMIKVFKLWVVGDNS